MDYCYSYSNLKKILQTEKGQEFIKNIELIYQEKFANKPIISLTYSKYKLIHTTGNRQPYEEEYFERRHRLCLLQILAVYDDKYIEPLEDLLCAICEEYTWILPPHNALPFNRFDYTIIDLFSAETALYLSETAYVLKDKLCYDIKSRINARLYERIVKNFESREYVFDNLENNWCAVCGAGIGATYLYAFPESFERVKDRIFGLMEKYILGIGEDGFCFEGANYWQFGFGFFSIFFDVYTHLTGEYPEILNSKKVSNTLNFLADTHLSGEKYVPYGDGGIQKFTAYVEILSAVKNLFGDKFVGCRYDVSDFYKVFRSKDVLDTFRKGLGFRAINAVQLFENREEKEKKISKYFPSAEVIVYRGENYSFTTKCGNNGESHSHNDVGVFEIVKNDKRLIADLGGGQYTWAYFNDYKERYGDNIFVCGSQSHSVPIIDGKYQKEEKDFFGKIIQVNDGFIKMDISTAYDKVINEMLVSYSWNDCSLKATYEYDDVCEHQVTYRFISDYEPKVIGSKVVIDELTISCCDNLTVSLSSKDYVIRNGEKRRAFIVDFIDKAKNKGKVQFNFDIK